VEDVSFQLHRQEILGFLGPSGAGKSTTQRILTGLLPGYQGTARVLGREVAAWDRSLYRRIGVSFEIPNHYLKLTARENLRLFAGLYDIRADLDDMLARLGLLDDADTRVSEFSKGMRVRLTLARALLHGPELLFLDEPTSGLDPVNALRIRQLIRQLREDGATVFLTTHDMTAADDLCDRVAFMVDGRIVAIDAPRSLRITHGHRTVRVESSTEAGRSVAQFPLANIGDNIAFLQLLRAGTVETIHTQETTLEDVFVRLTGKELGSNRLP
jgi:fluoroquinolone transport system ATP-binding protein